MITVLYYNGVIIALENHMRHFVGRVEQLAKIEGEWAAARDLGEGRMVTIRGRRRVGKTWLVEEFIERTQAPNLFFAASGHTEERELDLFAQALASSNLPSREQAEGVAFATWQAALVTAAAGSDPARPSVIVLDEFPYLLGSTEQARKAVLGAVQTAWDRMLSKVPMLLILIGSDQAMMEMITTPKQPLHQRAERELLVPPLNPAEAGALSGLTGADALDSYLVTGGFPKVVRTKMSRSLKDFLVDQLADDGTPLVTTGRLILDSELASSAQARTILSVIGEGFRKRIDIAAEVGVDTINLKPPLDLLIANKRVLEGRRPLSAAPSRDTRYEIVDPFLRFYMRFIDRYKGEIERGRGRIVADIILRDWATYRGKAIEALVRESIDEMIPDPRFGNAAVAGAYWTADNAVEVDLIGADRRDPPARQISFLGTIKWRDNKPIGMADYADLITAGANIPGVRPTTLKVAVSRLGGDASAKAAFDVVLDADDVLAAWSVR
jgi:AAA+ ATPase superfamily predicted ATPase